MNTAPTKRRWIRFSLRTLLVGVALFATLLGAAIWWQKHTAKAVYSRQLLLTWIEQNGGTVTMQPPRLTAGDPLVLFPYGDEATAEIFLTKDLGESTIQQIVEAFPEATIRVHTLKDGRVIKRRIDAH